MKKSGLIHELMQVAQYKIFSNIMSAVTCKLRDKDVRYQVGTSGYVVGKAKWTKLPCLNCLELNSTFYHLPSKQLLKSLNNLPDNVNIVIKASQEITHYRRLNDVEELWNNLWERIRDLKNLKCVLFQFPPTFKRSAENIRRLEVLKEYLPKGLDIAVEFRNSSWLVEQTYDLFKKLGWCVVGTYIVKRAQTKWVGDMPSGLFMPPKTCNYNYIRVHGKKKWRGHLSQTDLNNLHDAVADQVVRNSYVIFNNSFFDKKGDYCSFGKVKVPSAAVCNAMEFSGNITRRRRRRKLRVSNRAS